jgi:hypothetical protein
MVETSYNKSEQVIRSNKTVVLKKIASKIISGSILVVAIQSMCIPLYDKKVKRSPCGTCFNLT